MTKRPFILVTLSVLGTLIVSGAVVTAVDSQATSTSKSICVNKQTKDPKLRNNCRSNERFLVTADVLINSGKSAYDTWLELGNKGTKQDFINSLKGSSGSSGGAGATGPKGESGESFNYAASTYTPVWSATGFTGSPSATGNYTRVGNLVFVDIFVSFSGVSNFGSGQYSVSLPLAAARESWVAGGVYRNEDRDWFFELHGQITSGSSQMKLFLDDGGFELEEFRNGDPYQTEEIDHFRMSITYQTSSGD